eukprot:COSAG04_NODE_19545_length_413_cov_2.630573_1_plen_44_part_10
MRAMSRRGAGCALMAEPAAAGSGGGLDSVLRRGAVEQVEHAVDV